MTGGPRGLLDATRSTGKPLPDADPSLAVPRRRELGPPGGGAEALRDPGQRGPNLPRRGPVGRDRDAAPWRWAPGGSGPPRAGRRSAPGGGPPRRGRGRRARSRPRSGPSPWCFAPWGPPVAVVYPTGRTGEATVLPPPYPVSAAAGSPLELVVPPGSPPRRGRLSSLPPAPVVSARRTDSWTGPCHGPTALRTAVPHYRCS